MIRGLSRNLLSQFVNTGKIAEAEWDKGSQGTRKRPARAPDQPLSVNPQGSHQPNSLADAANSAHRFPKPEFPAISGLWISF